MSVVIGLKSGKEFVVDDKSYLFVNGKTGLATHVFTSISEHRVITIPPEGSIEFYNEPLKSNTINVLEKTINEVQEQDNAKVVGNDGDPNIG